MGLVIGRCAVVGEEVVFGTALGRDGHSVIFKAEGVDARLVDPVFVVMATQYNMTPLTAKLLFDLPEVVAETSVDGKNLLTLERLHLVTLERVMHKFTRTGSPKAALRPTRATFGHMDAILHVIRHVFKI